MNRKAVLIAPLLLAVALGVLAIPSVASVMHPEVMAEGWAFAKTDNGWIHGPAILSR